MNSFYKRLNQNRGKLSSLEEQVLEFILKNPEKIISSSIDELSKEIFISTATISRTCKQLGYTGFQEFKYILTQALEHETDEYNGIDIKSDSLERQMQRVKYEIIKTMEILSADLLRQCVELLVKANRVEFFGVGASLPSCVEAARKLTFAGRIASAREDWDELREVARHMTSEDTAVIISHSGETFHVLEYAAYLKKNNVPIIVIVGNENSRLEKLADVCLHAKITYCYFDQLDMSSRIPFSLILEFLMLTYLEYGSCNDLQEM